MIVIGDEMTAMEKELLAQSTAKYAPLTKSIKDATADLQWARDQADKFAISAQNAARLVDWLTKLIPLL